MGPGMATRVGVTIPQIHSLSKLPLQPVLVSRCTVVKQQGVGGGGGGGGGGVEAHNIYS